MTDDKKLQETAIEDTLSSIKNIVEQNSSKESNQDNIDDIINLTETEMVSNSNSQEDDLIDIKSFDESGESKPLDDADRIIAQAQHGDDAAIDAISASLKDDSEESVDDILKNLNKASAENQESTNPDSLSEKAEQLEESLKSYSAKNFEGSEEYEGEDEIYDQAEQKDSTIEEINQKMMSELNNAKVTEKIALKAVPGASGLQVGFPIEVLAEALRPMITSWVEENLPSVVEKLVKEELSKLADR